MELTIRSWFNEPEATLHFSHKVDMYIRSQIKELLMRPLGLLQLYEDETLHLTITTLSSQQKLEVKMGKRNKAKSINCGIWLPYLPIVQSKYPLEKYLGFIVEASFEIFKKWNVSASQIETLKTSLFQEILFNPLYELTEEEMLEIDENEEFLNEIKKNIDSKNI
jgi:hypothetical protein